MNAKIAELKTSALYNVTKAEAILERTKTEGRDLSRPEIDQVEEFISFAEADRAELKRLAGGELETKRAVDSKVKAIAYDAVSGTGSLFEEFKAKGWTPGARTYIPNVGTKTATFDGSTDEIAPTRREGVGLPLDQRYVHPAFQVVALDPGTTRVDIARQKSRTLPSTDDTIRDLDSTAAKAEVASVREIVPTNVQGVAAIESGVPNVYVASPGFKTMIDADLRTSILEAYDALVLDAIDGADPTTTDPGTDLVASLRQAIEDLAAQGFTADTALLSPDDAVALDLLDDGTRYYFLSAGGAGVSNPFGLKMRIGRDLTDPMVVDSSAFGKLYASGLQLSSFEDADSSGHVGAVNTQTIRLEGSAVFGVEREKALSIITSAS
jgi:hypothetical protein